MKSTPKQLRVAVVSDSGEVVALGKLVTVDEIMGIGAGELKLAFLPPGCDALQQAKKRLGIKLDSDAYSVVVRGEVRHTGVSRRFAEAFCKSYNNLNGRVARVIRPVK